MTRLATVLAVAALYAGSALAQSSGNFTDTVDDALCSINSATGDESCTNQNGTNVCTTPTPGGSLTAAIKLPNSSPALLVTPSLATGLYTNIPVGANSETAAIVVTVTDTFGIPAQTVTLSPDQTCVQTVGTTPCSGPSATCKCGVVYDERFQMVTSLMGPLPVSLILSTLSAHSFNFVEANAPGGTHNVTMAWYFGCDDGSGQLATSKCTTTFTPGTAAACAGPGTLTVQQVQNFHRDSQAQSTGP